MTYGRRARIGALVVSNDLTVEGEYQAMAVDGVSPYAARMLMHDVLPPLERLARMSESAEAAAHALATLSPDVVAYSCTSASFYRGAQYEAELSRSLAAVCGSPVVTTARACVDALRAVGARRIAIATPYTDDLNTLLREYVQAWGLEVAGLSGAQIVDNESTCALTPDAVTALVSDALSQGPADAVLVACTAVPIVRHIDHLEGRFGLPVVTANQATWWSSLRHAGVSDAVEGFGELLRTPG